jgi:membrane fusion protein (multidrug efflux system)
MEIPHNTPSCTTNESIPSKEEVANLKIKRKKSLLYITGIILFCSLCYFIFWFFYARVHEYTDDAYASGNTVTLTPFVSGIVKKIYVQDTDVVSVNTTLIELDTTDYEIALEKCKQTLANTVREITKLFTDAAKLAAEIENKKSIFQKNADDYERRSELISTGSISKEDFDHSICNMTSAYADLIATEQSYFGIMAQIDNTKIETHPKVEIAKQDLKKAWVNLKRCTIYAPVTGMIAQRSIQVGKWIVPGQALLSVVPLDQIWINANFKETQLKRMRVGQPVKVESEVYGSSMEYHGIVTGVSGGTGSAFSVLPAQNATGNWIKIVQRVPVRIDIPLEEIEKAPLRIGLSMMVTVDTHNTQGSMAPSIRKKVEERYATPIFDNDEEGVDQVIEDIILSNMSIYSLESQIDDEK